MLEPYAGNVASLRALIAVLDGEIARLGQQAAGMLDGHQGYAAIRGLAGIGPVLGAVNTAEIGDVSRFGKPLSRGGAAQGELKGVRQPDAALVAAEHRREPAADPPPVQAHVFLRAELGEDLLPLAGWGAGVAAPWPMPVTAVIAAARSQRTRPTALTGAVCAGIGMGCVLGTAIEPVTYRPRSWSRPTRSAIVLNMTSAAALILAGWRHQAAARPRPPRNWLTWVAHARPLPLRTAAPSRQGERG